MDFIMKFLGAMIGISREQLKGDNGELLYNDKGEPTFGWVFSLPSLLAALTTYGLGVLTFFLIAKFGLKWEKCDV